jgi:hypothetical protein
MCRNWQDETAGTAAYQEAVEFISRASLKMVTEFPSRLLGANISTFSLPHNYMNILIAEPLAAAGIELFQSQGWNTIVSNPRVAPAPMLKRTRCWCARPSGLERSFGESAEAAGDRARRRGRR